MENVQITRRMVLMGGSALALGTKPAAPGYARAAPISVENRLADLAGVDALPRDLFDNLTAALDEASLQILQRSDPLPAEFRTRLLKGLYSGVLPGAAEDEAGTRIEFSSALKWAAIDRTNNVISYCGGVPHFWATPPDTSLSAPETGGE